MTNLSSTTNRNCESDAQAIRQMASSEAPPKISEFLKEYARERPEVVALWCFGIGFIVGWKLKPW